jgi:pimeloyl-ACP methyl ester carboxylesterase
MNPEPNSEGSPVRPAVRRRKRGLGFYLTRGLLAVIGLVTVVLLLGTVVEGIAEASDRQAYLPPGQMVEVEGHRLHIHCTGAGEPTIILEAGAFSYSSEWYWVQRQLEPTQRVCAYDRAGNGWSEAGPAPRDGLQLTHELHALLQAANVPGPYVLVGHSLGGILNTIFHAEYPGEVLGIVMVDSAVPPDFQTESDYETWRSQNESAYGLMWGLVRVGAGRIIIGREFQGYGYPPEIAAELTALKSTLQAVDTWDAEVRLVAWRLGQQVRPDQDLGDLPLVVLWAGHPELTAPEDRAKLEAIWATVAATSTNSATRVIDGADHGSIIGNETYARQVSDAVLEVIAAAQTGGRLAP